MRNTAFALIGICGILLTACKEGAKNAPEEENIYETLVVSLSDRTLTTGYSATISGVQTVEIRPQVSGMITDILIEEGENVSKGEVLFIIDQTPYKAAYEIAVANVKSAEASLSTAQLVLESTKNLYEQDVVPRTILRKPRPDSPSARRKRSMQATIFHIRKSALL